MAVDISHLVNGMELLQEGFRERYKKAIAANPSARDITVSRLYMEGTDPRLIDQ